MCSGLVVFVWHHCGPLFEVEARVGFENFGGLLLGFRDAAQMAKACCQEPPTLCGILHLLNSITGFIILLEVKIGAAEVPQRHVIGAEAEVEEAKAYISQSGYFLFEGLLQEKTAIRRAQDEGRSATETLYKSINERVDVLVQSIVNRIKELSK